MIYHQPKIKYYSDYNPSTQARFRVFTLARQALYQYINRYSIKKVYLPDYCATGAYLPYKESGVKIKIYSLDNELNLPNRAFDCDEETIFHYIHHFGLYNELNIELLKDMSDKGMRIIDDRALTLPPKPYSVNFDAELYSLYKLCALPYGGIILDYKNNEVFDNYDYDHYNTESHLQKIMQRRFNLFASNLFSKHNWLTLKLYLKFFNYRYDFSNESISNWKINFTADSIIQTEVNKFDLKKVSNIAINNAKFLFNNIDKSKLLLKDESAYCSQALVGFPVKTDNIRNYQNSIMKKGVLGFSLFNGWNPHDMIKEKHILNSRYCLPCTAGLTKEELSHIADVANNTN